MNKLLTFSRATRLAQSIVLLGLLFSHATAFGTEASHYRQPPPEIASTLIASAPPQPLYHQASQQLALLHRDATVPMARMSQPYMGLAGFRFNPVIRQSGIGALISKIEIVSTGPKRKVLSWQPNHGASRFDDVQFSKDGRYVSAQLISENRTRLAIFDTHTEQSRILSVQINPAWGSPCRWNNAQKMLCLLVANRNQYIEPKIQQPIMLEHNSKAAEVRTYQNLLRNSNDEKAFQHYFSANLAEVSATGKVSVYKTISGLIESFNPSPNGQYVVLKRIQPPFSYLVRANKFPSSVEVWDLAKQQKLYSSSLAGYSVDDSDDIDANDVRTFVWKADSEMTLGWIKSELGPDGKRRYDWMVRQDGEPKSIANSDQSFKKFGWTTTGTPYYAIKSKDKQSLEYYIVDGDKTRLLTVVNSRQHEQGQAMEVDNAVYEFDGKIFITGEGAHKNIVQPFLNELDLTTAAIKPLFKSPLKAFEQVVAIQDAASATWIVSRETMTTAPEYFRVNALERVKLYSQDNPYPALAKVERSIINYKRADGVALQATLYRPKNTAPAQPLPTLVWIYPYEHSDIESAEQANVRWFRFHNIKGPSPVTLALAGYAVVVNPSMPIIQKGTQMNEGYLAELNLNAEALVNHLIVTGVSPKEKIAVGGQSYGAFSSANLLIHSKYFATAIVLSGAYNRTLTPFGFQREKRSFWEATNFYSSVSPFFSVDQLKNPILIMHGGSDENTGTATVQSRRFFHALLGQGVKARYVELPYEGHHFRGEATVLHTVAEMIDWLDGTIGKGDGTIDKQRDSKSEAAKNTKA